MNDFIFLNGKIFQYISRKYEAEEVGTKIERTLNGTAYRDISRQSVSKWSFVLEVNFRNYSRIKSIFDTHTTITLIDWDSTSYTVLWTNNFSPNFEGEDIYTITIDFEEV